LLLAITVITPAERHSLTHLLLARASAQGRETDDDVRKLSVLLRVGCNPNERDPFGRTALCVCATRDAAVELIRSGAVTRPGDVGWRRVAEHAVAVHYLGTIADRCDQLRQVKKCGADGIEPSAPEVARRMGASHARAPNCCFHACLLCRPSPPFCSGGTRVHTSCPPYNKLLSHRAPGCPRAGETLFLALLTRSLT
jgi:hypothetical protein